MNMTSERRAELTAIQQAIACGRLVWRRHALSRMMEREISRSDVRSAVKTGEIIQGYPTDRPFPSCLIAGKLEERLLHVVAAYDSAGQTCYIVTVYEPDAEHSAEDLKTRRRDDG